MDLFETPELLPKEVQDIIEKHSEMDTTYENCNTLIQDLEKVGYTCDYGLDGVPYELKKIEVDKQKQIIQKLEDLVHNRFTLLTLNDMLNEIFGEEIEIEDTTENKDECDLSDYNLLFESKNENTYGWFDIFYLKTREDDVIYITEVSYEFENLN